MCPTWNGVDVPLNTVIADPRLSAFARSEKELENRTEPGYVRITEENLKSDPWYLPKKNGDTK